MSREVKESTRGSEVICFHVLFCYSCYWLEFKMIRPWMSSTSSVVIQTQHCLCDMDFVPIFYWMVAINLDELEK